MIDLLNMTARCARRFEVGSCAFVQTKMKLGPYAYFPYSVQRNATNLFLYQSAEHCLSVIN